MLKHYVAPAIALVILMLPGAASGQTAPAPQRDLSGIWEPARSPGDGIQATGAKNMPFGIDIYNLMNSDTVTATNNNYATLWRPTGIIQARFMKISMQLEF